MKLKNDDMLSRLCEFGFHCDEKTAEGFIRFSRRIGNLVVTIANGQFENKIRVSMLQDKQGNIRTSYHDILDFGEMIRTMINAGLIMEESYVLYSGMEEKKEYDMHENPLVMFPQKPDGFMAQ